jgi:Zn-dependent M28 family amino/carboxypeptidase
VFGEEAGLLGTRYYIRNPVFPLAKTVANVNLEHLGRTDASEGAQLARAMFTGFDYSDVPKTFQAAGELTGVEVYDHPQGGAFFNRSDNVAFANAGIPAHTVCVALEFPDYHGTGDHWDKIDYGNMAKVVRMLGTGVLMLANNPEAPRWNGANPKTERYRKAQEKREPAPAVTQ